MVWEQEAGSNWVVASNSINERSATRSCTRSIYSFVNDACLSGITTVTFTRAGTNVQSVTRDEDKSDNGDDGLSTATIIIIVSSLAVVLGILGGAYFYWYKRYGKNVATLKSLALMKPYRVQRFNCLGLLVYEKLSGWSI